MAVCAYRTMTEQQRILMWYFLKFNLRKREHILMQDAMSRGIVRAPRSCFVLNKRVEDSDGIPDVCSVSSGQVYGGSVRGEAVIVSKGLVTHETRHFSTPPEPVLNIKYNVQGIEKWSPDMTLDALQFQKSIAPVDDFNADEDEEDYECIGKNAESIRENWAANEFKSIDTSMTCIMQ